MDLYQVAEVELSYINKTKPADRLTIGNCIDAYKILFSNWEENKLDMIEQFKILLLNRANRVLGISNISSGGITSTTVDPRVVFTTALKANATSIILAHNHPSGNLIPSEADRRMTRRLSDAGNLLDIKVEDHIIICRDNFYSFSEDQFFKKVVSGSQTSYETVSPF